MGACSALIGPFLIFVFLISLFLDWHVENDQWTPIATYVGLYRYTFRKTTAGQAISIAGGLIGKVNEKAKLAAEFMEKFMEEGTYWIWEARDKFCAKDIAEQIAQNMIPMLKERCQMWSSLATGSYIVCACFIIGSVSLLAGSYLNKTKTTLSETTNMVRIGCCATGSGVWIIGCIAYFAMTMYFPKGDEMSFAAGFWLATVVSILSLSVIAVAQCVESDVPGSARSVTGEQGLEMQPQGGGGKGGMGQQFPGGKGQQPPGQQFPGQAGPPMSQPGLPMSQGFVPAGAPPNSGGFALAPPPSYNQQSMYSQPMSGGYPPQGPPENRMGGMSSPFLRP